MYIYIYYFCGCYGNDQVKFAVIPLVSCTYLLQILRNHALCQISLKDYGFIFALKDQIYWFSFYFGTIDCKKYI